MKRTSFCVILILCTAFLVGCAVQDQGTAQSSDSARAELPQAQEAGNAAEAADSPLLPPTDKGIGAESSAEVTKPTEWIAVSVEVGKAKEKKPTSDETEQPAVSETPATSKPETKPASEPTPVPVPAPTPEPTPEPTPDPKPTPATASGNIYSAAEAVQVGNEYARSQYGVTIDTGLTAENASYFPGTADSVAWLSTNDGQEALNRAAQGNVDATFQYLAAMDGTDAVRAYARFNCTVRYNAASDEYIVVVLYG